MSDEILIGVLGKGTVGGALAMKRSVVWALSDSSNGSWFQRYTISRRKLDVAQSHVGFMAAVKKHEDKLGGVVLAGYLWPSQFIFSRKPVRSPADLKGLKVRVYGVAQTEFAKAMGTDADTVMPTLRSRYSDEAPKMMPRTAPTMTACQVNSGMALTSGT